MKNDRNQDRRWGGARPGSGRKPNAQKAALRKLLEARLAEEEWTDLFDQLCDDAISGNLNAVKIVLNYRFGKPTAHRDPHPGSHPELAEEPSPGLIQ